MAQLNVAEHRISQDGKLKAKLLKKDSMDFRVSTCPTLFGEKVVIRILDPSYIKMGIEKLGFEQKQKELFQKAISMPDGMY